MGGQNGDLHSVACRWACPCSIPTALSCTVAPCSMHGFILHTRWLSSWLCGGMEEVCALPLIGRRVRVFLFYFFLDLSRC